jgi:photosystem II stability/assembly factor-like uncharacterized protein
LDDNHDNAGVWKTTDGGASWVYQGSIYLFPGSNIHFVDEHTGYVSGQDCTIYKTTDSGANWTFVGNSSSGGLCNIWFVDDQIGYVAGLDKLLKTTNAGASWTEIPLGTHDIFACDIHFPVDAQIGYVVGCYGHIWKTMNGGATWSLQASGVPYNLRSVWFPQDAETGYIAADFGNILKTTDGGSTWITQAIAGGHGFKSICFTRENPAIGYLVGFESMILKLGDIVGIEEEQVSINIQTDTKLNIEPNPFVSYTTVHGYKGENFALYDISGRLVSTCRGNRIGEGLCAGVYFVMPENKNLKPVRIVKVR